MIRTRFAPSPTGPLHLGHAYSAITAHDFARRQGGMFLLRIEALDQSRARPEWEAQIFDDLAWLGLTWDGPVLRQATRSAAYEAALTALLGRGLIYGCKCSRRDIAQAASAPQEGTPPNWGPDGLVYPGTCRPHITGHLLAGPARRLDMAAALAGCSEIAFQELSDDLITPIDHINNVDHFIDNIGDAVLARSDGAAAYHLAVVVDDAAQDITHVVRGADLLSTTPIHALLQHLLGYAKPIYHHHALIRDSNGKRLAKRDDAKAIAKFRSEGASPDDIRAMVGLPTRSNS
ncbi:tRNA glutamyl-Q(34) synthetase GluQRS [bacterium]|nr:tRNA glutamyl-Q(34) synthetase GluQRS [bacterium]